MFSVPVFLHGGDLSSSRDCSPWSTLTDRSPLCRRPGVPTGRPTLRCCTRRCNAHPVVEKLTRVHPNPMMILPDVCMSERTQRVPPSHDCIEDVIKKALMIENARRRMQTNKDKVDMEATRDTETNADVDVSNQSVRKWEHTFDCKGFSSDNVFVKIANGHLIISAVKKEPSIYGGGIVTRIEKSIVLPQNVLPGSIRCKMLKSEKLVVEASVTAPERPRRQAAPTTGVTGTSLAAKAKTDNDVNYCTDDVTNFAGSDTKKSDIVNDTVEAISEDDIPEHGEVMTKEHNNETCLKDDVEDRPCPVTSDEDEKSFVVISDGDLYDNVQNMEIKNIEPNDVLASTTNEFRENVDDLEWGNGIKGLTYSEIPTITNSEKHTPVDSKEEVSSVQMSQSEQHDTNDTKSHHNTETFQTEQERQKHHTITSLEVEDSLDTNLSTEEFKVRFEFPCHQPESIRVTMDDQTRILHIMTDKDGASNVGRVHKVVPIPPEVDELKLSCHFQDGLLSVRAPYKSFSRNIRELRVVS